MRVQRMAAGVGMAVLLVGCTVRVSVDTNGGDPNSSSVGPSVSADGRFVAFASLASDLVNGDSNGLHDVYRRDLKKNRTIRVSLDKTGGDPNFDSSDASISSDGTKVAFLSNASDLVDGDTNGKDDIFVRNIRMGVTTRASVDSGGGNTNDHSTNPDISADGRVVAFASLASDLVQGDTNGFPDVFVRNLVAGTTTRVSVDTAGGDADNSSFDPSISADGRYVAFVSYASDLVAGDANGKADIFVRDLVAGTTVRASVDTAGGDPNNFSDSPDISADGRRIAFASLASDLVAHDNNVCFSEQGPVSCVDVFVRDLVAGTTIRVSVDAGGGDADKGGFDPSISGNGGRVAFASDSSDLVANDGNRTTDIFVRDLVGAATTRASVDTAGGDPDSFSREPAITADGRAVAFESFATDLVEGDGNNTVDIFVTPLGQ